MDLQELRRHVQLESFGTKHFNKVHIATLLVAFTFRALDSFVQIPFRDANLWCQLKNEWMNAGDIDQLVRNFRFTYGI